MRQHVELVEALTQLCIQYARRATFCARSGDVMGVAYCVEFIEALATAIGVED